MAFGGVDTGRNIAQLALIPIISGNRIGLDKSHKPAAGIRIAAAAVLLMKLEASTVMPAKVINRGNIGRLILCNWLRK